MMKPGSDEAAFFEAQQDRVVDAIKAIQPARQDIVFVTQSFVRPANTTAYAIGDYIANSATAAAVDVLAWKQCHGGVTGLRSGFIVGATLIDSTNESTLLQSELWISNQRIAPVADNAALAVTDAEAATVFGVVQFNTGFAGTAGTGGNTIYPVTGLSIPYRFDSIDTLWGCLIARNAYTPVSAEAFTIRLALMPSA